MTEKLINRVIICGTLENGLLQSRMFERYQIEYKESFYGETIIKDYSMALWLVDKYTPFVKHLHLIYKVFDNSNINNFTIISETPSGDEAQERLSRTNVISEIVVETYVKDKIVKLLENLTKNCSGHLDLKNLEPGRFYLANGYLF